MPLREVEYIQKEAALAAVPALDERVKGLRKQMERLEELGKKLVDGLAKREV